MVRQVQIEPRDGWWVATMLGERGTEVRTLCVASESDGSMVLAQRMTEVIWPFDPADGQWKRQDEGVRWGRVWDPNGRPVPTRIFRRLGGTRGHPI